MLAFILASGDEGTAAFWSCRIGAGVVDLERVGGRQSRVIEDQKPNGSRLSGKGQLEHFLVG